MKFSPSMVYAAMALLLLCCWFAFTQVQADSAAPQQTEVHRANTSDSTDTIIHTISKKVQRINDSLKAYTTVEKDVYDESTEGGVLIAYYDHSKKLKKIAATYYGEMGKAEIDYYFVDKKVLFVLKREYTYDKPMYIEGSQTVSVQTSEYYFANNRMIRWKNYNNELVAPNSDEFIQEEKQRLEDAKNILNEL